MRKLKLNATFTLKDSQVHARLVVTDQDDKILFDTIGRTKELSENELKKLPSNEQIVAMLSDSFKEGIGDKLPFEKVKNNLE